MELGHTSDQGHGNDLATIDTFRQRSKGMEEKALSSFLRMANTGIAYPVLRLRLQSKSTLPIAYLTIRSFRKCCLSLATMID